MNPTLDEIEDNFCSEIKLILNDVLDSNEYEDQKEELIESLLIIFQNRSRQIFMEQQIKSSTNQNFYSARFMPNSPYINLISGANNSLNFASPQFPQYAQNSISQSIPMNSSSFNLPIYPNYPYPIIQQQMPQFFQPQFNQQPNFSYYVQPNLFVEKKKIRKKKTKKVKHKKLESHKEKSSSKQNDESKTGTLTFEHKEGVEFNGIFSHLTKETHGNIHDNGTIEVTSNSINPFSFNQSTNHPKNLLGGSDSHGYLSNSSIKDPWITFDFKSMKVELSSYTIKIVKIINQIKNWSVEVSDDKNSWDRIDNHNDDTSLYTSYSTKTFDVQTKKFARFIRFTFHSSGVIRDNFAISIEAFEFYGRLKK